MSAGNQERNMELLKQGYSEEEIVNIYELGRFFLENGEIQKGEIIFSGVVEVAPHFAPAWLGLAYVQIQAQDYEAAALSAKRALDADSEFVQALLYLVACLITSGDYSTSGTHLGEIGEKIESGRISDPFMIRFYKAQLARYQSRRAG